MAFGVPRVQIVKTVMAKAVARCPSEEVKIRRMNF
jgi:hypothetical protein